MKKRKHREGLVTGGDLLTALVGALALVLVGGLVGVATLFVRLAALIGRGLAEVLPGARPAPASAPVRLPRARHLRSARRS